MKKIPLILLCGGLIFTNLTVAQTKVGLIGGMNFSNVDIKDIDNNEIGTNKRIGAGVGGVLNFTLSPNIMLEFSPMYSQKGARLQITDDPNFVGANVKFNLNVIEMPILLKISFANSSSSKTYFLAGPVVGFINSSKLKLSELGLDVEADLGDVIKSIDFNIGLGGGVTILLEQKSFFIEARYLIGLTDIVDDGTFKVYDSLSEFKGNVKTKDLQVMVGLIFPLGGN